MSRKRPHSESAAITQPQPEYVHAPDPDSIKSSTDPVSRDLQPAPYDDEEAAVLEREKCDYTVKITQAMARNGEAPRRVRVYADGIYDLFHAGHARQLMQAKNVFPKADVYLIVGCCSDALTRERKGKTVMTEDERYASIRHCRYVDEVVRNAPWSLDEEFLVKHKIDFVAHDDAPYTTGSGVDVYADIKAKGMFVATQRTEGVSTSDIVARIVRDYDMYIRRNLARGYSAKDLNVSFLRGQRLRLANKVDEVKGAFERKREEVVNKVEETSKEVIGAFLSLFGQREWSVDAFWQRSKNRLALALSPTHSPAGSPEHSDEEEVEAEEEEEEPPPPARKRRRGGASTKNNGVAAN